MEVESENVPKSKKLLLEGPIFYFHDCGRKRSVGRVLVVFVLHFRGGDVAERDFLYLSVVSWDLSQDS